MIDRDFEVDEAVLAEFREYLRRQEIPFSPEDLQANREAVSRQILEEVLDH